MQQFVSILAQGDEIEEDVDAENCEENLDWVLVVSERFPSCSWTSR